jgi:hypothetical protein
MVVKELIEYVVLNESVNCTPDNSVTPHRSQVSRVEEHGLSINS